MLLGESQPGILYRTEPDTLGWESYPAKSAPWKNLKQHSLETAAVMTALVENFPTLGPLLPENFAFWGLTHDCGKISSAFLVQDGFRDWFCRTFGPAAAKGVQPVRHEVISEAALRAFLGFPGDHPECIAGWHHGKRNPDVSPGYGGPPWDRARNRMLIEAAGLLAPPDSPLTPRQQLLCAGLLCAADWIASDEEHFGGRTAANSLRDLLPEARAALHNIGMTAPEVRPGLSFEELFGFPPNAMQQAFAEEVAGPGVYCLETVMGAGKTEAALYAAYRLLERGINRGIYFALPTRLTSDRIHLRVNDFLHRICPGGRRARLMHGAAFLRPAGGEFAAGGAWFAPAKRALLYPYGVGTVDQALLGVLNRKHFFVRLAGLAGKVVIVDEAHSYDFFTGFLLDELCRLLTGLGCTVIVLSATLGQERRSELLGAPVTSNRYPLLSSCRDGVTRERPLKPPKTIRYKLERITAEDAPARAVELARQGCNVLLMANTVAETQHYYRRIKSLCHEEEFPVGLLHSNFPQFRRQELESVWVECLGKPRPEGPERPRGSILVASQVLEQSVDIDADVLISELAPSDLLLQRLGRAWRHRRKDRPLPGPLAILIDRRLSDCRDQTDFKAAAGPASHVYHPYVLYRTHRLWRTAKEVAIPADLRRLIAATYVEPQPDDPPFVRDFYRDLCAKRDQRRQLAEAASRDSLYFASLPQGRDDESAATRYQEQPRQTVVLLKGYQEIGSRLVIGLLSGESFELGPGDAFRLEVCRAFHRNSVSLARYRLPEGWLAAAAPATWRRYGAEGELLPVVVGFEGLLTSPLRSEESAGLFYTAEFGVSREEIPEPLGGEQIELDW